jgi:APA family basic amino acid/polyamine antiporter
VLASLAFIFSLWAIAGSGQEIVYWGLLLLLSGVPFYVMIIWKKNT